MRYEMEGDTERLGCHMDHRCNIGKHTQTSERISLFLTGMYVQPLGHLDWPLTPHHLITHSQEALDTIRHHLPRQYTDRHTLLKSISMY
jgi:hypothetical protein